ncbi:hypothetical protein SAMD00019534_087620 [Acytostelium subglobosum LB1]|uniref:hypothetical protein n=1 Tax=Acytostelium subglobosum LB1 TaxID=1410327 RepID=UPI0006448CAE|nr:hypothetical protein SAMD00019534_087620 [Acytostelium subglobosum LB1]GAM25587.1 hypothetical protein SAMD00019534_087620 [Acytostelium subglobosum LB1]|eukprot:XP_012751573.1 hypothetical protein SAMD00019534_087620 [Acytostelium subglobosum LB1]
MTMISLTSATLTTSEVTWGTPETPQDYYNYCNSVTLVNGINVWVTQRNNEDPPWVFASAAANDDNMFSSIIKSAAIGTQVAVMVIGNLPNPLSALMTSTFQQIGASKVFTLGNCPNYVLIGNKGHPPQYAVEAFGDASKGEKVFCSAKIIHYDESLRTVSISQTTGTVPHIIFDSWMDFVLTNQPDGINVWTFSPDLIFDEEDMENPVNYNTITAGGLGSVRLASFLESVDTNSFVIFFSKGNAKANLSAECINLLSTNFGARYISQYASSTNQNDKWHMISRRGQNRPYNEYTSKAGQSCQAMLYYCLDTFKSVDDPSKVIPISVGAANPANSPDGISDTYYMTINDYSQNTTARGFIMCVVNEVDGRILSLANYDTTDATATTHMIEDIINVAVGNIVVVCSSVMTGFNNTNGLTTALASLGAAESLSITSGSSYALIGLKGSAMGAVPEMLSNTGPVSLSNYIKPIVKPLPKVIQEEDIVGNTNKVHDPTPSELSEFDLHRQEFQDFTAVKRMQLHPK